MYTCIEREGQRERERTYIYIYTYDIVFIYSICLHMANVRLRSPVRAAAQTGGAYITVPDANILAAIAELGRAGIFAEPAGATAFAGLRRALSEGLVTSSDPVLVLNTGNGLKDTRAAMQAVSPAPVIEPTLPALRRHPPRRAPGVPKHTTKPRMLPTPPEPVVP